MATGFHGAPVRRVVGFLLIKAHRLTLFLLSSFLGSLLRLSSVMLRYEKYHQSSLKSTTGGGAKRLSRVVKTSANHLKALIGIVSGLSWASPFLSRSSLIFKRLGFYTLASDCVKLVRSIHLTTSTYTFNYYYFINNNVTGR